MSPPEGGAESNDAGALGGGPGSGGSSSGSGGPNYPAPDGSPCDPDADLPFNPWKHSCCNGHYCRGDCLEQGDTYVCDCGGVIGGCPVGTDCCLDYFAGLFWVCQACILDAD